MNALLSRAEVLIAAKSVDSVAAVYKGFLVKIASDTYMGGAPIDMWRQHKAGIEAYGRQVFFAGMTAGGVENPQEVMDAEERAYLDKWIREQKGYTESFARWVAKIEPGVEGLADLKQLDARIELWLENLRALGSAGYAFARKNQTGIWHLGATEQHCTTCAMLNGKRRRLKWFLQNGYIPRQPGSDTLECGGWNCDCYITSPSGEWLLPVA